MYMKGFETFHELFFYHLIMTLLAANHFFLINFLKITNLLRSMYFCKKKKLNNAFFSLGKKI